ncbi:TolC family protein [Elizabethkingia anophelis]|jgi:OMF family outer membrane factor|uniref:OMF family outer membrane factor n=2 Tax=Bacteroidota TaxID=976 RepID=A0A318UBW4_9SPHI|nr:MULTISPECIES: TolC family protein [Bacteroidota]MDV2466328.1 TolC family protein [Elizabethkingia anophelis]OJV56429.1 MAG: transporter [Bacteroidetes bacterium 43-16]MDV3725033.1 TolC family protein [Elizabethkingia anophelis]MDV3730554.1 TolC family protein [Elizabethkingia anophelis]MDV3745438.1 TolC family protein [Elizabethkingia anophelis]
MLVNARKLFIIPLIFIGWNTVQAQEVWTLKQCTDTAQVYNKTLQINRNHISISEQREKEAKANLIPKVTANADYKYFMELPTQLMPMNALNPQAPEGQFRDLQFGVPHNINANVQLAMPLYNPQVYGVIENTKIANKLTLLQFQKSEEQVLYDITMLYYNAQILKHQLDFLESNMLNTQKLLKNMELLKKQLLAKGTDVSKVKLQTEQLNTQRENVHNKYISILNALKLNIGIPLERNITVVSEIEQRALTKNNVENILDLKIIQTQNKLLNSELSTLNKSRFLPSLNLIASYGTTGFGYDKTPNDFLKFYPIGFAGLQLTYPLFNGTVTQRKINQKKLEISNNELQAQLIGDKNKMETENALRQRTIAQQTVINTENQITLAQSIYEQTILQQKQGTATLTDVLLADNTLREAQQNYLSAVIDYLKADLELKKLAGTIKN